MPEEIREVAQEHARVLALQVQFPRNADRHLIHPQGSGHHLIQDRVHIQDLQERASALTELELALVAAHLTDLVVVRLHDRIHAHALVRDPLDRADLDQLLDPHDQ